MLSIKNIGAVYMVSICLIASIYIVATRKEITMIKDKTEFLKTKSFDIIKKMDRYGCLEVANDLYRIGYTKTEDFKELSKEMGEKENALMGWFNKLGIRKQRGGEFYLAEQPPAEQKNSLTEVQLEQLSQLIDTRISMALENKKSSHINIHKDFFDKKNTKQKNIKIKKDLEKELLAIIEEQPYADFSKLVNQAVYEFLINHNKITESIEIEPVEPTENE